jgi:hypothetical protein
MPSVKDGPCSLNFKPVPIKGNNTLSSLSKTVISKEMKEALEHAPGKSCVSWGIPFQIDKVVLVEEKGPPFSITLDPLKTEWLVFMHTSDIRPMEIDTRKLSISSLRGKGRLGEHAANYIIVYDDGTKEKVEIKRRHQVGMFQREWGDNSIQAVTHSKPFPYRAHHEQTASDWGGSQTRVKPGDNGKWIDWLWAWENPFPEKRIVEIRLEAKNGAILISAISQGKASSNPLRWQTRHKAIIRLAKGIEFEPSLDEKGLLKQIQLDLGQVISAQKRPLYPNKEWARTHNNQTPELSPDEVLIEYTAHQDAKFHLADGKTFSISELEDKRETEILRVINPATQRVTLQVMEKQSNKLAAVRLHIHGQAGEYLAPIDRHRIPNPAWFEDYSVDYVNGSFHYSTYIKGETAIDLPLGNVYIEVSKGFEMKPVRKVVSVKPSTEEIVIKIDRVLPWRERGWVSADTHVHFLSPSSALLEGAGEGVNIVNLLASQWGELMTNVGDFDGKTTYGSREAGGDSEYLVRVGTENRQHVMGHISLLGYRGNIIAPMTTGGPDESALGDPVGNLLTEWARQCKKQGGLVILPHFPSPRLENAASIVSGDIDGIEFCRGIDPYSLLDWYRYLNCGYMAAAVGGTDKMSADVAIGSARTYAYIDTEMDFTYQTWMDSIRKANTFVTCGPLMEFSVEGKPPGSRIKMSSRGGTVNISWKTASVTMPMTKVELIINGEVYESKSIGPDKNEGYHSVKINKSSWIALLVRGHYADKPKQEVIAAHSSPVMIDIEGSSLLAKADALTILEQIEGALAYLDTVGTRAETKAYKRMRLILTSAHRSLHNRMHKIGHYHNHTPIDDHPEHHRR